MAKRLAHFTVKGATLEEVVELNLFQTTWGVQALLIAGCNVAGSLLTFGLGLRAFQNDDISRHICVLLIVGRLFYTFIRLRQAK